MNQSVIENLNEKLQDAFLHGFRDYLNQEADGRFSGEYRGFHFTSVFQPIVTGMNRRIVGYEAFLRPVIGKNIPVEAKFVFRYIEESGGLVLLDRICRTLHLLNFLQFDKGDDLLFLNVHASLLSRVDVHGKVFESILHSLSVPPGRVVIELEESYLEDSYLLDKALGNFRERGFKIALSDFGRERTYLKRLWQISPDYVKLHRDVLVESANNEKARMIFPFLIGLIQETGASAIVQGIETAPDLNLAEKSGARLYQGFGLFKPEAADYWLANNLASRTG